MAARRSSSKRTDSSLLLSYVDLLSRHGVSKETVRFREQFPEDLDFQRRAEMIERVYGLTRREIRTAIKSDRL